MKKWMKFMVLAVMPVAMLTSCDDDDDNPISPGQDDEAMVMVVHASPDAGAVDLLVDNVVAGANLSYPDNTGYLTVEKGDRDIKVNAAGTQTTVINTTFDFEDDTFYTVFAAGTVAEDDDADLGLLVLTDDLTAPTTGNAKVRFVHLAPDAPAVDIVNVTDPANEAVLFDAQNYRDATAFASVPAGTYNLEVRTDAGGTTVLPLNDIVLEAGKIYTVFANGFVTPPTGNTNALGAEIIEHKTE
jgi:hypothetical protein